MYWLSDPATHNTRKDPPGLELVRYWSRASSDVPDTARRLLSYLAGSLLSRGWLPAVDKLFPSLVDHLGEPEELVRRDWDLLVDRDLLSASDGKVASLAGLFSTRPTGMVFRFGAQHDGAQHDGAQHEVALLGGVAALAVARALAKAGEVRASCGEDGQTRLSLGCEASGIVTRKPESLSLFLPAWDGSVPPSEAGLGARLFRDDEALGAWQDQHGDPNGMPIPSLLFPMAAGDLGDQLGAALESLLNHLPDFD